MINGVDLKDKGGDKRGQNQVEVMEQRLAKLNHDISILQSRTGIKKQQVSQKNLDQLMSLLNKKIQQYNFQDTMIAQNHYQLVQKGMDAPSLERKLQEQRFLAEKELSSKTNQEKSMFWMDIVFSKEGIDSYLENNQNFVMFNSVDTMRSRNSKGNTFANRLLAKKSQLHGAVADSFGSGVSALTNASSKYDQLHRLESEQQNVENFISAMNPFQVGNYSLYCAQMAQHSTDFKEVWTLLSNMVPPEEFTYKKRMELENQSKNGGRNKNNEVLTQLFDQALQYAYSNGITYLERIYKTSMKSKKQNFQRIYDVYNIDQIPGFEDRSTPIWQQLYQLFRAGDYVTIGKRCQQYSNVPSIVEFYDDLLNWLDAGEVKNQNLSQKLLPQWDAFRYQIYLIMIKEPQCVDDIFIDDLDDCLWMNLKCCQRSTHRNQLIQGRDGSMIIENGNNDENYARNNRNELLKSSYKQDETDYYFENIYKEIEYAEVSKEENRVDYYSWVDWTQLEDLRKMLYESFKETPGSFSPSRVLLIQLLTLDFIGFVKTLNSLEKSVISKHELIHFLIVLSKSGLIRASVECAVIHSDKKSSAQNIFRVFQEFEENAEKEIILYAKDRFETHPDLAFAYIESLPIKIEDILSKFANIFVHSKQNYISLFKPNLELTQQLSSQQYGGQYQSRQKTFYSISQLNKRLLKVNYVSTTYILNGQPVENESQTLLAVLAKIISNTYISKLNKVETALEILDNVNASEEIGRILKEQYRLSTLLFSADGLKNQLKESNDSQRTRNLEILDKFFDKYFSKKSKLTYKEEKKQRVDGQIIQFFRQFYKSKTLYQKGDFNITPILSEMQEQYFISSSHRLHASNDFYSTLNQEEQQSYFEFIYLVYICVKNFIQQLKQSGGYNQSYKISKPEDVEKAKSIYKTILKYCNEFYDKHHKEVNDQFYKSLADAKYQAQVMEQI